MMLVTDCQLAQLRLATGKRINSAADDAAGYSIAKKFNARAEGLGQALNNIGSAKNLIAVAEGHLSNIVDILTQMKTRTTQAADDSLGTAERTAIKGELVKLTNQIDLEVNQARWNDKTIFSGAATTGASSGSGMFRFQIGAGASSTNDTMKFDLLAKANVSFDSAATTKGFFFFRVECFGFYRRTCRFNSGFGSVCSNINGQDRYRYSRCV